MEGLLQATAEKLPWMIASMLFAALSAGVAAVFRAWLRGDLVSGTTHREALAECQSERDQAREDAQKYLHGWMEESHLARSAIRVAEKASTSTQSSGDEVPQP